MSIDPVVSQDKSPVYQNSPLSNYRDSGYRQPEAVYRLIEPVFVSNEMMNDFTSFKSEEAEKEIEEVEETEDFDEAFLSEIEKSHRKMGKE